VSPRQVRHFLVVYDIADAQADVQAFETDYDAALAAYSDAEDEYREDPNIEVVLLGSDSLETVRRTHSSYFELSDRHLDEVVERELEDAEFLPR
jgi:hypothetical protein